MKSLIKDNILGILGIILGLTAGYFYWKFVGCNSGNCAITSDPMNSTLYGGMMGWLLFSIFKKEK